MKEKVDLIIKNANQVITLAGYSKMPIIFESNTNIGIIERGAIAISEDTIIDVGTSDQILEKYTAERYIDADNKIVTPGFIDAHTHLIFAGSREDELVMKLKGYSYLDILAKGGGINRTVKATRKATKEELIEFGSKTLDVMLAHGTTTVEAKSGYGLDAKSEIKILEVANELDKRHKVTVIPTLLAAHAIPPEYKDSPNDYVDYVINEIIPKVGERQLAKFNDVFCEKGVFDIEQSRRILLAGKEAGLIPKVHADELTTLGGTELAAEVDAISADHLLYASDRGLKLLAEERIVGVLLPATTMTIFSSKYANFSKMKTYGVPIALSTDFNPNCWSENLQFTMTLGCYMMKMTPEEILAAVTINAAHALGIAAEVGSIEKGKKADLVILDIPSIYFVGYRFGINFVNTIIKNGEIISVKSTER